MKQATINNIQNDLTWAEVNSELRYDADTGHLYWRTPKGPRDLSKPAGTKMKNGRRSLCINGQRYYNARLVWLLCYKRWPTFIVDHIDQNPANDRIENLREVTSSENNFNRIINTKTRGIQKYYTNRGNPRWRVRLQVEKQVVFSKSFLTLQEAEQAYEDAALEWYGILPQ